MDLIATKSFLIKTVIVFVSVVALYYTSVYTYTAIKNAYLRIFPPAPETPESKFGKLPVLKFTSLELKGNPTYTLSTNNARFPNFKDRIKVYPITEPKASLLSESNIKNLAKDLGFTSEYTKLNDAEFEWVDGNNKRSFRANVVTGNYTVASDFEKLESAMSNVPAITQKDASTKVLNFIRSKGLFTTDELNALNLQYTPVNIKFGKIQDLTEFPNLAKIFKVDIIRSVAILDKTENPNKPKILASYRIYGPSAKDSSMTIYVTNHQTVFKYPIMDVTKWQIDYSRGSEYFLSNISAVWDAVKHNKGVVAKLKLNSSDNFEVKDIGDVASVDIRNVTLSYYEPKEYIKYLQPIYVFEGTFTTKGDANNLGETGDIVIYYPAVRGDWIETTVN